MKRQGKHDQDVLATLVLCKSPESNAAVPFMMLKSCSVPSRHALKNTCAPPHALTHLLAFPFLVEFTSIFECPCCYGNSGLVVSGIA